MESPKSLTAIIHVKFDYKGAEQPISQGEMEILSHILDRAVELSPESREILVKFADYLSQPPGQSPA